MKAFNPELIQRAGAVAADGHSNSYGLSNLVPIRLHELVPIDAKVVERLPLGAMIVDNHKRGCPKAMIDALVIAKGLSQRADPVITAKINRPAPFFDEC